MSQMIEVNVAEATGAALDWMTGMATGALDGEFKFKPFQPSTDWSQGGPLIDEYITSLERRQTIIEWRARTIKNENYSFGGTALIAACRAIVTAKLGGKVMVPVELVGGDL